MRLLSIAAALLAVCVADSSLLAQSLDLAPATKTSNIRIQLPSGTIVHARNFVVFEKRNPGGSSPSALTVYIETPTPASDSARLAREAREVAQIEDDFAQKRGISRMAVAICRSQACVDLRGAPSEQFWFARAKDGKWKVAKP